MIYTKHASVRAQQRGIPPLISEWLLEFGDSAYDGHGAIIRYFNKKSLKFIAGTVGKDVLRRLSEFKRCYLVQSATDGEIISVGKRYQNQRINRK